MKFGGRKKYLRFFWPQKSIFKFKSAIRLRKKEISGNFIGNFLVSEKSLSLLLRHGVFNSALGAFGTDFERLQNSFASPLAGCGMA
ncbi:MAG: hypothetical protein DBX55_09110 [Verrucomicrobia bacterium]|nr:MAG: hypothetical protein DBX55_09110 [Verrucomicrobiota bacterium]